MDCLLSCRQLSVHLDLPIDNAHVFFFCCIVRDGDTVKHYRIRQLDEGGFFIARRVTFRTLAELVRHYSRDADGLCVNLRKPCSQVSDNNASNLSAEVRWALSPLTAEVGWALPP